MNAEEKNVGREEIDEVEEDSTETGRQMVHCSRPEKTSIDRLVDRCARHAQD